MSGRQANDRLLERVAEILERPDAILFIGSGLSRWSGLPSWPQLLSKFATFVEGCGGNAAIVRREITNNNLLQAASYAVDQVTQPQFAQFMRKACLAEEASPHEIHKYIVNLGPTCYISTNYDRLLEAALYKWGSNVFRVITNKQVAETADISQARAENYVFKPHGDINDVDSLVLSREQYRAIRNKRSHVIETLKTLLVSRPVVFVGFGLQDPDFFYVKDLLFKTYSGGDRGHYAFMPNVSREERGYWRNNYGMHLVSYNAEDGDHSELLEILRHLSDETEPLQSGSEAATERQSDDRMTMNQILALARHGARLSEQKPAIEGKEFQLSVSITEDSKTKRRVKLWMPSLHLEKLISEYEESIILIGEPGAGKSYALKKHCATLGENLRDACLQSGDKSIPELDLRVPIFIDLKRYNGDLEAMIEESLPPDLSLNGLQRVAKITLVLDSFNEAPSQYFESGEFMDDVSSVVERINKGRLIIASRPSEALRDIDLVSFELDSIRWQFIIDYIEENNLDIEGVFRAEIIGILQKPLFFNLFEKGIFSLNEVSRPHDIYVSMFGKINSEFRSEFKQEVRFERVLASLAYQAIDGGRESLPVNQVVSKLDGVMRKNESGIDGREVLNWLINNKLLVPEPNSRVAFFHQTITEFLAARQLAKLYEASPSIIESCLQNRRWDHALLLAVGFMSQEEGSKFVRQIVEADIYLAIRAVKYIEYENVSKSVANDLLECLDRIKFDSFGRESRIAFRMKDIPVDDTHVDILRSLVDKGGMIGGAAAQLLVGIAGSDVKGELLSRIIEYPYDYNFCSMASLQLKDYFVEDEDIDLLRRGIKELPDQIDDRGKYRGLVEAYQNLLMGFDLDVIGDIMMDDTIGDCSIRNEIFYGVLGNLENEKAADIVVDGVIDGDEYAHYPLYSMSEFSDIDISPYVDSELVLALINACEAGASSRWALAALRSICKNNELAARVVADRVDGKSGVVKVAMMYCLLGVGGDVDEGGVMREMEKLVEDGVGEIDDDKFQLIEHVEEVRWVDYPLVIERWFSTKNVRAVKSILGAIRNGMWSDESALEADIIDVNQDAILDLVAWVAGLEQRDADIGWLRYLVAEFIAEYVDEGVHSEFIRMFNEGNDTYQEFIATYLLARLGVTTDSLSPGATEFLLSRLDDEPSSFITADRPVIGAIATESFVEKRLLPLLEASTGTRRARLLFALKHAGERHERRYVTQESF